MAYYQDYTANPQYGYEDEETRRRRLEEERLRQQQTGLNEYLAKNESGNNPNIGYHFGTDEKGQRRSSAYGKYGITSAAYRDIQQADPYFSNKSMEQLNPQDQDRAQTVYNSVLARQLRQLGVDATPGNLAAANFAGAKGYSDYLKTGNISPQAAAANGGAENVKRVIEQRRQFGNAPASAAALTQNQGAPVSPDQFQQQEQQRQPPQPPQPPQPQEQYSLAAGQPQTMGFQAQPAPTPPPVSFEQKQSSQFIENQNNLETLARLRSDTTLGWRQKAAGEQMYSLINNENQLSQAEQQLKDLGMRMSAGDSRANMELSREVAKTEGSWLRYVLFKAIGPAFAREAAAEASKLNLGNTWTQENITMPDGTERIVEIERRADGSIARGRDLNGQNLSMDDLGVGLAGGLPKGVHVNSVQNLINPKTGERVQSQLLSNAKTRHVKDGKPFTGSLADFQPESQYRQDQNEYINAATRYLNKTYGEMANPQQMYDAYIRHNVDEKEARKLSGYQPTTTTAAQPSARPTTAGQPTNVPPPPSATTAGRVEPTTVSGPGPKPQLTYRPQQQGETVKAYDAYKDQAKKDYEASLEVWKKKQDRVEKAAEQFNQLQATAEDTISNVERFMMHPGFEAVIGVTWNPLAQYIPATDARDAKSIYNQIKGQQFLVAYNQLRGAGHISTDEGKAATRAIAALDDTGISEAQWRKNANDYMNILKRGINRAAVAAGKEMPYPELNITPTSTSSTQQAVNQIPGQSGQKKPSVSNW